MIRGKKKWAFGQGERDEDCAGDQVERFAPILAFLH